MFTLIQFKSSGVPIHGRGTNFPLASKSLPIKNCISEASLILPDFTISVHGSSCNYLVFCLVLAPLLSLSVDWHSQSRIGCQEIDREIEEERARQKNSYELPYTEIINSVTIGLSSERESVLMVIA